MAEVAADVQEKFLDAVILSFDEDASMITALVISNCNGTGPVPFSKATIDFKKAYDNYFLATWFSEGLYSIAEAMRGKNKLRGEMTFENLINVVFRETSHLKCLRSLKRSQTTTEAKLRNTLAAHYFQPLAYGSVCYVDRGSSVPSVCEFCSKEVQVGDTSLGNPYVWHGRADIVLKNSVIKVEKEIEKKGDDDDEEEKDDHANGEPSAKQIKLLSAKPNMEEKAEDGSGEPSTNQRKLPSEEARYVYLSVIEVKPDKNPSIFALSQALAEGIVNAFSEANKDKSLSKKFIPSFLATDQHIRIILYNCDRDILLLSDKLEIWNPKPLDADASLATLNETTLLLVWLAVNMNNYEMNMDEEVLAQTLCSNFRKVVGDAYAIYQKSVKKPYENVNVESEEKIRRVKRDNPVNFQEKKKQKEKILCDKILSMFE